MKNKIEKILRVKVIGNKIIISGIVSDKEKGKASSDRLRARREVADNIDSLDLNIPEDDKLKIIKYLRKIADEENIPVLTMAKDGRLKRAV